ncbi:MAG: pyridoxamine 5'-phosphate oxidase family protein [Alphaproteobacteria bacterium]|nr:pyridoxamine 5'-phosphate oxidase family protein [Alphaproteobacteria bacterium]
MNAFTDVISTREQLRAITGHASPNVREKVMTALSQHGRDFIAKSPFLLIGSADEMGFGDVSPKGDPPGFVKIIDDRTLAIPDRPGNRLADTLENVLSNPQVGLLFLIPGKNETLRVNGTVTIVHDEPLRQSMAIRGRAPALVMVVDIKEVYFHCSRCMVRSSLWRPELWPDTDDLPSMAQIMVDQSDGAVDLEELSDYIKRSETTDLY